MVAVLMIVTLSPVGTGVLGVSADGVLFATMNKGVAVASANQLSFWALNRAIAMTTMRMIAISRPLIAVPSVDGLRLKLDIGGPPVIEFPKSTSDIIGYAGQERAMFGRPLC